MRHPIALAFTNRELLVLQLLARGYTLRQVASLTGTDQPALSDALVSAVWALGASSRAEAIAIAHRQALVV